MLPVIIAKVILLVFKKRLNYFKFMFVFFLLYLGVVRNVQITDDNPTGGTSSSNNKINNFLESFTASLGDDMLGGMDDQVI